jgi:hypothetical protein
VTNLVNESFFSGSNNIIAGRRLDEPFIIKIEGIDAHGLNIQGRGYLKFLPKSLGGGGDGQGILEKCQGFIAFLYTMCFENCWWGEGGGPILTRPLPPSTTLVCIYVIEGTSDFGRIEKEVSIPAKPGHHQPEANFDCKAVYNYTNSHRGRHSHNMRLFFGAFKTSPPPLSPM